MMRGYETREARFSARTLTNLVAANLPQMLAVRAAAGDVPAEILLYDEIGYFGVTAKDFVLALAQCGDGPITLRINSPGGDVFDGMAIYNALRARRAPVAVSVDGIAASAASYIAMAGSTITMAEASMMMIHNAFGIVMGNRHDMLDTAMVLEKIDGQLAAIYAQRTGRSLADMASIMDAETWFTSTEAKAAGLCDAIATPAVQARAGLRPIARSGLRALVTRPRADFDPSYPACDPDNPDPENPNCDEYLSRRRGVAPRSQLPPYDPDGDGDNDAEEALGMINAAMVLLGEARESLTGADDDGSDGGDDDAAATPGMPMVPGARAARRPRAAATEAEWVVGADRELPIDTKDNWDGPAAAERILDDAGYNGDSPDPAKAKRGFLAWDHHNPKLKGSFKLPFADMIDGTLKAVKGGIDAAASRLPDTDVPDNVKVEARAVLDSYEKRMKPADDGKAARLRRLRLAEAETVL